MKITLDILIIALMTVMAIGILIVDMSHFCNDLQGSDLSICNQNEISFTLMTLVSCVGILLLLGQYEIKELLKKEEVK
jgi:hypothetical protein